MTTITIKEQVAHFKKSAHSQTIKLAQAGKNVLYIKEWNKGTIFTTQYAWIGYMKFDLGTFQSTDKNAMKRARQEFKKELIGEGE